MEDLFRANWPLVLGYLRRRTSDRELAEDLAQETFLRATRAFLGWRGARPEAWLLAIAGNVLIDHVRKRASTMPLEENLIASALDWTSEDPVAMTDVLRGMPQQQARLLRLVYEWGFTHAEVATMVGATPAAVKTALWRARETFRAVHEARSAADE